MDLKAYLCMETFIFPPDIVGSVQLEVVVYKVIISHMEREFSCAPLLIFL